MKPDTKIRADRSKEALVPLSSLEWSPSPLAGVERKMLERDGGEVALATTVVRYAAGSSFSGHTHEHGEEFLVLEGVFSDEHGDYPTGTYIRNPPGSKHAPFSKNGCTILVKLRYMKPTESIRVVHATQDMPWILTAQKGLSTIPLFEDPAGDEQVMMFRIAPGTTVQWETSQGGEEIFLISGRFSDKHGHYESQTWIRRPHPTSSHITSEEGCVLWYKRGHLPPPT